MTPIGESIGAVATATSWVVRSSGSIGKPISSATMRIDCWKPWPRTFSMMLVCATSGVAPNSMMSRTTSTAL